MKNLKILVADDEPRMRKTMSLLLRDYPNTEIVEDGNQAMEKLKNNTYDLVITDNQMPGFQGVDIVAYVNDNCPQTKAILMTNQPDLKIPVKSLRSNIFEFLQKPFNKREFDLVFSKFTIKVQEEENISKLVELGQMTGAIIHEINNPLGILMMKSCEMKMAVESKNIRINDNKDFEDGLTLMEKTINQLSATVNATKAAYSKNNHKTFKPFTIEQALRKLDEYYSVKFKSFVSMDVPEKYMSTVINGNKDQIVQALYNLIRNAQQEVAAHENPWVKISVSKPQKGQIVLSVSDSGKGIPLEIQTKIFSSFYSSKDADKGTGLGLSIVKRVVESHRGLIQVDVHCQNTKFDMMLPVDEDGSTLRASVKKVA